MLFYHAQLEQKQQGMRVDGGGIGETHLIQMSKAIIFCKVQICGENVAKLYQ